MLKARIFARFLSLFLQKTAFFNIKPQTSFAFAQRGGNLQQ